MAQSRVSILGLIIRKIYKIPCRVFCVLTLILQACCLDYYLVFYNNLIWCLWIIPDIVVISVFVTAFVLSYRFQFLLLSFFSYNF